MKYVLAFLASLAIPSIALAEPATYEFDASHSQIVFEYGHLGFSTSTGIINGVTGKLLLNEDDPANSSVEAVIPLSGLTSIATQLDEHLFGADFFNTDKAQALATFKSTAIEMDGDEMARVTGDLTLNGVTKPVTLDVMMNQIGSHPMSGKPSVGFDASTQITRSEFNLGKFAPNVDDGVNIRISVEMAKSE